MRRAVPAIVITLIGLAALASFRSTKPAAGHRGRSALGGLRSPATAPPTTAPPATAPPPHASGSASTTAPASHGTSGTFDGDSFDNRYGTVQVRVTVQNGQITGITALQMPFDHPRSQYISQQAEPLLRQEALQAQSAQIDVISGATYTSEGYAQSLQSALDKSHA
jgi:uncharacterized protein with FMN-binding domain